MCVGEWRIGYTGLTTKFCEKEHSVAENFPKKQIGNPARIPPQTPPAGGNSAEAKRKINIPRKTDFRFAESVLKPHALPEYLEGRTPKEKHPFLFQEKFHPRQIRNARSVFSFGVAGVLASAWGFLRTYDLVSLHHARRACDIICFGNECELGTIDTQARDVTKKLKRTQSYVSRVEVGEQRLDILELQKFAKLYDKDLNYFVK